MKKLLSISTLFLALFILNLNVVNAQEQPTLPADTTLPIGEEQDPNAPVDTNTSEVVDEKQDNTFTSGLLAGALVGVVVGGVLMWLFKDKFYK